MKILILGAQARYERYMPHLPFIRQQELVFMDKESSEAQILAAAADADILFVDAITPVSGTLMAQMPGSPFKKILTTVYPFQRQNATGKRKILRKVWRKCTARCSVWPTRDTCTRSP